MWLHGLIYWLVLFRHLFNDSVSISLCIVKMRAILTLRALADATYDTSYHHKLRGRIWRALRGTPFEEYHDDRSAPIFAFSNPFPWGDIQEGDTRRVLVASPYEGVPEVIATDVQENSDFHIGEMPFEVTNASVFGTDVGEPGTDGTLRTSTGVYIPLEEDEWDEYGVDVPYDTSRISWTPEHGYDVFRDKVRQDAQFKFNQIYPDYQPFVDEAYDLFEEYSLEKTYSIQVPVTQDHDRTLILSKWEFGYHVQSDAHRRVLNLLLDAGVGWRNRLGFGFLNLEGDSNG